MGIRSLEGVNAIHPQFKRKNTVVEEHRTILLMAMINRFFFRLFKKNFSCDEAFLFFR